jgi:hypothetical protein
LRFIGSAERRLVNPECISPQIERQQARAARSANSSPRLRPHFSRYSAIAKVSQILTPSWVRQGTRIEGRAAVTRPGSPDHRRARPLQRNPSLTFCTTASRAATRRNNSCYDTVDIGGRLAAVRETAVHRTPFCTLLHLEKDVAVAQPRVLLVAPMSGHFATLLRGTAQTLLADQDVYITDWHNARDIGLRHGGFGFDEFIDHVITFLQVLGPGVHVVGVCQPCVAVLAAVAIMAEDSDPAQHDLDGRPDRCACQPDRGQPAGDEPADRLVRAQPVGDGEELIPRVRALVAKHDAAETK